MFQKFYNAACIKSAFLFFSLFLYSSYGISQSTSYEEPNYLELEAIDASQSDQFVQQDITKLNSTIQLELPVEFEKQMSLNENIFDEEKKKKEKKPDGFIWLPVVASNPANGLMLGVAPSRNWLMGNPETTNYSSLLASIIYTTKSQLLLTLKGTLFADANDQLLMYDWRFFQTSQPTFGLGTGPNTAKLSSDGFEYEDGLFSEGIDEGQMMEFNFLRLYQTYFKRIGNGKGTYLGAGYHLDRHYSINDQLLKLDTVPPVITSSYAYSQKYGYNASNYTLSGISGNFLYDTRDNTVSPQKGIYGLVTYKYNPEFLGSYQSSSSLWTEFRNYFTLKKDRPRNLIGVWLYGNFQTSGDLPYMDLPAVGWDQFGRSGRAYTQGRFRGQSVMYSEAEWRFPLQKEKEKWGGVLFVNATTATNKDADIKAFDYINTGYGAGIRYMVNEKSRTNICLDYGIGNYGASGFYLSVNEVF